MTPIEWLPASINQFHFLRPWWLLCLIPAVIMFHYFWKQKSSAQYWLGAINEKLIAHLLDGSGSKQSRWPWIIVLLIWVLTTIAVAGPTWEKIPLPVHQRQNALVIVLDLSLSMRAEDIKPSRMVRARHKILDILGKRDEGLTALVAYSGDAHIVSPLTDDNATVANLLPALSPTMMPVYGSNPVAALELARQLISNAGLQNGRVLLVTDGITDNDLIDIGTTLADAGLDMSVLGIGTLQGAPIPSNAGFLKNSSGTIVVPQLPRQKLDDLARNNNGRYIDVALDDNDIDFLLPDKVTEVDESMITGEREFDQWHDRGYLLVLCLLPLALLGFRRGWLLMLPLTIVFTPQPSHAFEWKDLWQSPDQQASRALAEGDAATAANKFENKQWKGTAQYKAQEYEQAADNFAQFNTADAHYNRGNALARAGKLDDAIKAYDQALKLQPEMEDAQFNKELLEKLKQQQNQQQNSDQNGENSDQSEQSKDQQNNDQQGDQQQNSDQQQNEQSQDQQNESSSDSQNQQSSNQDQQQDQNDGAKLPEEKESEQQQASSSDEQQENKQPEEENAAAQQASQEENENKGDEEQQAQPTQAQMEAEKEQQRQKQAMDQWLRQIPDEPSGLLRRKFDYEHRLKLRQKKQSKREQPQW